jgi:RNA polymerase sigma-70 factor (ECF subfamily)
MAGPDTVGVYVLNSDHQLLRDASRGDEKAFTTLYRRYQGGIYRFVLQMTGSTVFAEEITQEVFLTLAVAPHTFDARRGTLLSFLYGIARNLSLRAIHRQESHDCVTDKTAQEPVSFEPSPLEDLVRSEEVEAVRRAVLALPSAYREAVVLCDLQEMSYADAAQVLGCPVGTVRSKLNRGRALLCERLSTAKRCCV